MFSRTNSKSNLSEINPGGKHLKNQPVTGVKNWPGFHCNIDVIEEGNLPIRALKMNG